MGDVEERILDVRRRKKLACGGGGLGWGMVALWERAGVSVLYARLLVSIAEVDRFCYRVGGRVRSGLEIVVIGPAEANSKFRQRVETNHTTYLGREGPGWRAGGGILDVGGGRGGRVSGGGWKAS